MQSFLIYKKHEISIMTIRQMFEAPNNSNAKASGRQVTPLF